MKNNYMNIGDSIKIGDGYPTLIIAEIGSNQNKDIKEAYRLIDMAKESGVDAIKFQTLKASDIAKSDTPANAYGEYAFTKNKKYWSEVLESLVLPYEWHEELFNYARKKKLIPFSTPESLEAVDLLESLNTPLYKVASMDITYKDLLIKIAQTKKPVILSSGIASDYDLNNAIKVLRKNGSKKICILHCVSEYPPDFELMSLKMIEYYKKKFQIPVGFSDHCEDNMLDGVAIALGACIIEKHITMDKKQKGPDHAFALDPVGLKNLVITIRTVEKALPINQLLNDKKNHKKMLYGRSIITKRDMKAAEIINKSDIDFKRPGNGISPFDYEKVIGKKIIKEIKSNNVLSLEDLK